MSKMFLLFKTQGKGLSLLLMMAFGALVPQAHTFSFLIQYLLMAMLFLAFLDIEFKPGAFKKSVLWVAIANVAIAFISYLVLSRFDQTLALAAFITGIAPTAIAAPVIIGFIGREVEYVTTAVILTNVANAIIVPIVLPSLLGDNIHISLWEVLYPVMLVMFVPLGLSRIARYLPPKALQFVRKGKTASFPIWLVNLFIVSAKASDFLLKSDADSFATLVMIALTSLVICIANFGLGAMIGGHSHWQEASQSLGQKNLTFVIWVALTFINPIVAMGPTFYILYHHIYNSWSIYQYEKSLLRG